MQANQSLHCCDHQKLPRPIIRAENWSFCKPSALFLQAATDIGRDVAVEFCTAIALKKSYHPVQKYLQQLEIDHPHPGIDLDNLASRYLGTDEPLHQTLLKKHLIASVARIFQPGCKHDSALILQGDQGRRKSTFLKLLYGARFFIDTMAKCSDRDELMRLHSCWCLEWAELETVFGRKDISYIKAFLASTEDSFRLPYARENDSFARRFVLAGTVNHQEFLNDPTGSRRFWIIPVKQQIDCDLVEKERDLIWAAAVHAYRAGEIWHLTNLEEQLSQQINRTYHQISDVWSEYIEDYIDKHQFSNFTSSQILSEALELPMSYQDKKAEIRVAHCLSNLGWERCRFRDGTKQKRGWKKKETCFEDFSRHRVTDSHNPDSVVASAVTLPVTPTVSPPSQKALGLTQASPLENLACDALTPPVERCLTRVTPSNPDTPSDTTLLRHTDTNNEQKNFSSSQIEETDIDVDNDCDALTPPVEECLTSVTPSNSGTASDTALLRHTDTNNEQKNFSSSQIEETRIDVDDDCDALTPPVEECLTSVTPSTPDTPSDTTLLRHTDTKNEQKNFSSSTPPQTTPDLGEAPPEPPYQLGCQYLMRRFAETAIEDSHFEWVRATLVRFDDPPFYTKFILEMAD
ncbi:MAG: hypothetical protein F6K09_13030, partial [Merismopedia sp. SIO2A8]|nr:hypothetical protein [Merismopedia sp. SIO2A8]